MGAPSQKVVCIVGAGIAGPAFALQLLSHPRLAARFRPVLFDQAPDPTATSPDEEKKHRPSAGAAVGIFSNGLYPLYKLGLKERILEASSEFAAIQMWRAGVGKGSETGPYKYLNGCKDPNWSAELQTGPRSIERRKLQALLLDAVRERGGDVQWERKIHGIETPDPSTTKVVFDDGSQVKADLLIGADGGFSQLRRFILAQRNAATAEQKWLPDFMNQTGFYGISPGYSLDLDDPHRTVTHCTWLDQGYLSTAWLPGGKIRWDLVLPEREPPPSSNPLRDNKSLTPSGDGWESALYPSAYSRESSIEILRKHAGAFHPIAGTFGRLFETSERIIRSPLRQRVWKEDEIQWGNVGLIGDASRLMLPSSGQGTGFAVEDATVLARLLLKHLDSGSSGDGMRSVLEQYARERVPRSRRMATTAQLAGKLGVGETWAWRTVRNLTSAWLPVGIDRKSKPKSKEPWPFNERYDVE